LHVSVPAHATHAPPLMPQAAFAVPGWQAPLESRQPAVQVPRQRPPVQFWPPPHAEQLLPPLPQAALLTALTQEPLLQHVLQLPGPQPPASTPPSTQTELWQL